MYRAMIADRRHSHNGQMFESPTKTFLFYAAPKMKPVSHQPISEEDMTQIVKAVTLHYGTFNGIPVWTEEKMET